MWINMMNGRQRDSFGLLPSRFCPEGVFQFWDCFIPKKSFLLHRMREIEKLPELKKKTILETLDDLIRANKLRIN